MKFVYADNLDLIDPNYDFATDSHSAGRQACWDDQYPHEYMRTPPYDGFWFRGASWGDHRFPGRYSAACIRRPVYGDRQIITELDRFADELREQIRTAYSAKPELRDLWLKLTDREVKTSAKKV